jgi:hypothetical protein
MWLSTVVYRPVEAAAVNAIASGSQHRERNQPSDRPLGICVCDDKFGYVADRSGFGLPSGLEPQAVHGLARARHRRHHQPVSEPASHASPGAISLASRRAN